MSIPARDKTRYQFELVDAGGPDSTPARIRLRHFLKAALRQWKLRCIGGRILDSDAQEQSGEPANETGDASA